MSTTLIYILASVGIVSLVSLAAIWALAVRDDRLKNILLYMVSFSAGALLADVFFHLLPEIAEQGYTPKTALYIMSGIVISFIAEKLIHWRHCHLPQTDGHIHSFASMNLIGDSIHNFIDGMVIAASYLASLPVGIATTIAVILHEIPQEIGDFGVLLHGGFSKKRALLLNFLTALSALVGAMLIIIINTDGDSILKITLPFAAGTFVYIAGADLIPELHKEVAPKKSLGQLVLFCAGIAVLASLLILE